LKHPNLTKSYGIVYVEERTFNLVMQKEVTSLKSLLPLMKERNISFPIEKIVSFALNMCFGLNYLHLHNVMHRDLNLGNLLLSNDWVLKVADFGTCKLIENATRIGNQQFTAVPGSPYFSAPEVFTGFYRPTSDVWSFGVVFSDIITNLQQPPFEPQLENSLTAQNEQFNSEVNELKLNNGNVINVLKEHINKKELVQHLLRRRNSLTQFLTFDEQFHDVIHDCLNFEIVEIPNRPTFGVLTCTLMKLKINRQLSFEWTQKLEEFIGDH